MTHLARLVQRFIRRGVARARASPVQFVGAVQDVVARLPATHVEAARRLSDPRACQTGSYRSRAVSVSPVGLVPPMDEFRMKFVAECVRRGFPMFMHCGIRSLAEQQRLFDKGVSKARPGQSAHNYGCAVDVVHYARFWDLTQTEWAVIGAVGKEVARKMNLKVVWGGDWSFYDPAHWELADWRQLASAG